MVALQAASTDGKRTDAGRDRLRDAREPQRQLDDDAERAFRADHQPREVVAGRRLLGAARRGHELAVRLHDFERQHIVLHGAVAHGVGAGAARRRHAAERRVGAGIDREEQALVAQVLVERLAGDAGLDHAVEVLGMHRQHPVHVADVDRDAAVRRVDLTLERRAGAERDHRHAMAGADPHDLLHVGDALREHHRIRRLVHDPGQRVAVLLAHRLRGDEAVAEFLRQHADRGFDRSGVAARRGGFDERHHGARLEHDPEKWKPVFGRDHAPRNKPERRRHGKAPQHLMSRCGSRPQQRPVPLRRLRSSQERPSTRRSARIPLPASGDRNNIPVPLRNPCFAATRQLHGPRCLRQ